MRNVYEQYGFNDNPFTTQPLGANSRGKQLLIGRQGELNKLMKRLATPPSIPTVEGKNGIGKTSLVQVAAFSLFEKWSVGEIEPFFASCRKTFQLDGNRSVSEFRRDVLFEVAQTLFECNREPEATKQIFGKNKLDVWLNSPLIKSWSGGLGALSMGKGSEPNASSGFAESGFEKAVEEWLREVFPRDSGGGVVCIIDNMELLRTSQEAQKQLEQIRDPVLGIQGIRWVLCGALGIIRGVASSPRLSGFLADPIQLEGVAEESVRGLLDSRVAVYSRTPELHSLPITGADVTTLYKILDCNLRETLRHADDYCMAHAESLDGQSVGLTFSAWLDQKAESAKAALVDSVGKRGVEVFRTAVKLGGAFAPGDYEQFGCQSIPALRPHVRDLESAGMLVSTLDDDDRRRKTICITPRGWLAAHVL